MRWCGTAFTMPYSALVAMQQKAQDPTQGHMKTAAKARASAESSGDSCAGLARTSARISSETSDPSQNEPSRESQESRLSYRESRELLFKKG